MESIYDFFKNIDNEFVPSLSSIVDLEEYIEKVSNHAVIFLTTENNEITALVAIYCNDTESLTAYITSVAVKRKCRGKGLAKLLINSAICYASQNRFKRVLLEVYKSNLAAINLYKGIGFIIIQEKPLSLIMEKTLND